MHLHLLDTSNLIRHVNPQTDVEVALYERVYDLNRDNQLFIEALDEFSCLSSEPTLCYFHLEAVFNEREALQEEVKELRARVAELELELADATLRA